MTIYCAPKIMRPNQYNYVFFKIPIGVYQFDLKGNNDKIIEISDCDFEKHFELLKTTNP